MARAQSNLELNKFVATALLKRGQEYDELKSLLRECRQRAEAEPNDERAAAELATLISSVTANVSAIHERKHESLVSDILTLKLWNAAPGVLSAILNFTRNLVIANSAFTHTCLQLIVYSFTPPPAPADPADPSQDPNGPWRPSDKAITVHQALLPLLSRVLGLVPTAPTNMLPLIMAQMPHKLRDRNTQCLYLCALFRVAEDRAGAPIREALLTAVVEHVLSLDVEIRWEDIADVPPEEAEGADGDDCVQEDIFELEGMLASELDINAGPEEVAQRQAMLALRHGAGGAGRGGWEGAAVCPAGGAGEAAQASTRPPVDEMANKLDSMMELVFQHLARRIAAGELRQVWDTLLAAFERTVLNTHRSKFTQYLLFYLCLSNPSHCPSSLLSLLLTRLRDTRQPSITRAACAAYLASFLARAAFLPDAVVVHALQELCAFCVDYCNAHAGGFGSTSAADAGAPARAPPPPARTQSSSGLKDSEALASRTAEGGDAYLQRHMVLYAAMQATLYVLCYHMQPLVGVNHSGSLQAGDAAAAAKQPTALNEAAPAGHNEPARRQLADAVLALVRGPIWQVLNHPRLQPLAVCLPSVAAEFVHQASALGVVDCRPLLAQLEPATRSQRPLEMFFPFDPYLLRRSSRYLQLKRSYVRWRHGHPQAAAPAVEAEERAESEGGGEDEVVDEDDAAAEDAQAHAQEAGSDSDSSGDQEDGEHSESGDELAGHSGATDGVLTDPLHRGHGLRAKPHQPAARTVAVGGAARGHAPHARAQCASVLMGTSYMSYASAGTSQGDGGASPYGMSPYENDMLVRNPLGASPGSAVPMSLGTPEGHFMAQVPHRISRR